MNPMSTAHARTTAGTVAADEIISSPSRPLSSRGLALILQWKRPPGRDRTLLVVP